MRMLFMVSMILTLVVAPVLAVAQVAVDVQDGNAAVAVATAAPKPSYGSSGGSSGGSYGGHAARKAARKEARVLRAEARETARAVKSGASVATATAIAR